MRWLVWIIACLTTFGNAQEEDEKMDLWKGECYDENSKLQQTLANRFLNLLRKEFSIKPNALLLDVGCGNGRITSSLLTQYKGIQVLGIDSSFDMIDFAKKHFANTDLNFFVDRAEELQTIQKESVDAITSFSCLHWVKDQKSAFQSMYHVLKPNGWIGLIFGVQTDSDGPLDDAFAKAFQEEPWRCYFQKNTEEVEWNFATPKKVETEIKEVGFVIRSLGTQNFQYYFESKDKFKDWILTCAQQLKLLPVELQESCAMRIANLYLQATLDFQPKDGRCMYQFDPFMVMATKSE